MRSESAFVMHNGECGFNYHSPHGDCSFYVERTSDTLRVRVEPGFGISQRSDEIAPWREAHPQDAVNIDEETTRFYLAERKTELRDLVQGGSAVSRDDLAEEMGDGPVKSIPTWP